MYNIYFRVAIKKNSPVILNLCLVSKYQTKYSVALFEKRNKESTLYAYYMELNKHR